MILKKLFTEFFLDKNITNSTLPDLNKQLDIRVTIKRIKEHFKDDKKDIVDVVNYTSMLSILFITFILNPFDFVLKISILSVLAILLLVPMTSQFFFFGLPILAWLALYFNSTYIPNEERPKIFVKFLPMVETILYGDNLSDVLSRKTHPILDVMAWLTYGVLHFVAPFLIAIILFLFGPPTVLRSFGFAFGYINIIGVVCQNFLPMAPPWYKKLYGFRPANYGVSGSPGGLMRIDHIFKNHLYTEAFSNSAVIFGALPSLHSACATLEALFFVHCFPKLRGFAIGYVFWLWWSTMYLSHHYFIDLMSGAILSYVIFTFTKYYNLPKVDPKCSCRWAYTTITRFSIVEADPFLSKNNTKLEETEDIILTAKDKHNFENMINREMVEEYGMKASQYVTQDDCSVSSSTVESYLVTSGSLSLRRSTSSTTISSNYLTAVNTLIPEEELHLLQLNKATSGYSGYNQSGIRVSCS